MTLRPNDYDSNGDIIPMACKEEKGDLISREALNFELRQQLAYHKEKAKLTTINNDKMAHSLVATGIQLALDIIDNAPNVEAFTKEDIAGAYNEGYACGSRENTRPQGEWIANPLGDYVCNKCSWVVGKFERNFCPNCGADMKGGAE